MHTIQNNKKRKVKEKRKNSRKYFHILEKVVTTKPDIFFNINTLYYWRTNILSLKQKLSLFLLEILFCFSFKSHRSEYKTDPTANIYT